MPRLTFRARLRGHAETPFVVGFGSLVFGLLWAGIYCSKHGEFTLWHKVGVFVLSPVVGFAGLVAFLTPIFILGLCGDWLKNKISRHRRARAKGDD